MEFKEWLLHENDNKIFFSTFANDGTVIVYINGKRYVYITDAFNHEKWKKMIKFSPWKVLNIIKQKIKNGSAKQIDPEPSISKI